MNALKLPKDDPRRVAFERLADPPEWEFYHLQADPIEFVNRAGDGTIAAHEARLKRSLTA